MTAYSLQMKEQLMPATSDQSEAIKQIGDLSKWIATVETGSIAAIGALLKSAASSPSVAGCLAVSVALFVSSIIAAAGVLLSLPAAIQDIKENEKVWDRQATIGPFSPPLRNVLAVQLIAFALGILGFGLGVIGSICGWK